VHYVEGESESEVEQMDVEIESNDEGGSVEDVELGGEVRRTSQVMTTMTRRMMTTTTTKVQL